MSAIINVEDKNSVSEYRVLCKGAPEVLKKFMINIPKDYDKGYLKYVKNGARVLAMAYKVLPKLPSE
jgi:cation-transporting ATPase 13A1